MFDLLTLAGIPTAVGASEAVHQQRLLDEEAEAPERQEPFYIDVFCDAQSKKKDEVHDAIVVLKDGKVSNIMKPTESYTLTKTYTATPMAQRHQDQAPKSPPRYRRNPPPRPRLLLSLPRLRPAA